MVGVKPNMAKSPCGWMNTIVITSQIFYFLIKKLAQMTNIPNMAQCLDDYVLNTPTYFYYSYKIHCIYI